MHKRIVKLNTFLLKHKNKLILSKIATFKCRNYILKCKK